MPKGTERRLGGISRIWRRPAVAAAATLAVTATQGGRTMAFSSGQAMAQRVPRVATSAAGEAEGATSFTGKKATKVATFAMG